MKTRVFLAVLIGYVVSRIVLVEPGLVGLFHDWAIPPFGSQLSVLARETFDGWHHWGLGAPVVYSSDYPVTFFLAALTFIGVQPEAISKAILFCIPAISFLGMSALAARLGLVSPASLIAGGFYAVSPVLFNKLVSGQLSYLFGYAALPLTLLACERAFARQRFRDVLVFSMMLVLTMSQIQLGVVAFAFVILYALLLVDAPYVERFRTLGIAFFIFMAAESPTVIGIVMHGRELHNQLQFTPNAAWLDANSMHPQDAVRFLGYVAGYFDASVRDMGLVWQVVSWLMLALAVMGFSVMPPRMRLWCGIPCVFTLLFVTGSKGVLAPLMVWFFLHCSVAQVFRELYHVMAAVAIAYALALGWCFAYLARTLRTRVVCGLFAAVLVIYLYPIFSGNLDGWTEAFPVAERLRSAYDRFGDSSHRVAWFPIDQPLSFNESGAGVDPLAATAAGSLWQYALMWPLTAVDLAVRDGSVRTASRELEALSVGTAVFRRNFTSELPRFWFYDPHWWHFFDVRQPLDVAVGMKVASDDGYVAYALAHPLPRAVAADAIAYVPARLNVIAQALRTGYVPFTYGSEIPRDVPYVLFADEDDLAAEATDGYEELEVNGSKMFDARKGFVPLPAWYFYRPAYADVRNGLFSLGTHTCRFTVAEHEKSAVIIVGWIATPTGGRVRVSVGRTTKIFFTKSSFASWRSVAIDVGSLASGDMIRIDALDADAEVALRTVRVLSRDDFRLAMRRLAVRRSAARAVVPTNGFFPFHVLASGHGRLLPVLHAERNFRLDVRACASKQGLTAIEDENGYALARVRHGLGCFTDRLGFDGSIGTWKISLPDAADMSWTLEEREYRDTSLELGSDKIFPGTFLKTDEAAYPFGHRIFVLNEAFNGAWVSDTGSAQHTPTAMGTNAWITPTKSERPLVVRYVPSPIFHAAYAIGVVVICAGLLALL